MSASSSTTSQPPLSSSPPSAWRLKARCRSKAPGWTASAGSKASILDVLQTLHRQEGLTVLLVEQNVPAALAAAERGYVLQTGRIVAEGASRSLLDSDLVRRAYLGM
jgi:ABC-type uncharacterized transport system ATPase subunit